MRVTRPDTPASPVGVRASPVAPARTAALPRAGAAGACAAALAILLLVGTRVSLPADLDGWVPAALPGEAVHALGSSPGGVLAGTGRGLHFLDEEGHERELGVRRRVNALLQESDPLLVATTDGLLAVSAGGGPPDEVAFADTEVHALDARAGEVWAGTGTGLHRRVSDRSWERRWPAPGQPDQPVPALLAVDDGVLFAHPDGLALWKAAAGTVHLVHRGVTVVALLAEQSGPRIWAGLRGHPLLLVSSDAGRSWRARGDGLGLTAVHAVVPEPSFPRRLLAAGSGLADGTGNAGVQNSDDGGESWQARQGQLSNTHVFTLLRRHEPVPLVVRLAGLPGATSLSLPVRTSRLYAGTNGGGVYTHRDRHPLVGVLAEIQPVLRLVEPMLAGLLLLACFAPAYSRLRRTGPTARPGRNAPPAPGARKNN